MDIEEYMEYLKYRFNDKNQEVTNKERGIMRKVSSLKSFYNYYYRNERLQTNPASLVQLPKMHEKDIIRLDIDEVALLLDEVENGESLTEKQKAYHAKTKIRDLALLTLMLGTGIRVSECVGLDVDDIDLKKMAGSGFIEKEEKKSLCTLVPKLRMPFLIILTNAVSSFLRKAMKKHSSYPFKRNGLQYAASKIW